MGIVSKLVAGSSSLKHLVSTVGKGAAQVLDHRLKDNLVESPVLVTCEKHEACLNEQQTLLQDSHWAFDPGALSASQELSKAVSGVMIASTYSRLLIDVNRPIPSDTLIRTHCDAVPVEMNSNVNLQEISSRVNQFHSPFHLALGAVKMAVQPSMLLSVHSFNKEYPGGPPRDYEVGVLCAHEEDLAEEFKIHLEMAGISARVNEPYSGKQGIMFSVQSGACAFDGQSQLPSIMFEFRNDVCIDQEWRDRAIASIASYVLTK